MQIKFDIEEIMIMDALVEDAKNVAKKFDKQVYNKGKRICQKLVLNAPVLNLKRSELIIIGDIVEHTLGLLQGEDKEKADKESEEVKENKLDNMKTMTSIIDKIVGKLNEQA